MGTLSEVTVTVVIMKVLIVLASLVLPRNDLTCSICMDIMQDLDDFITSDTTEQQIGDFIIQSQLPAIIDAFVHDNMDPTQVCTTVFGACPWISRQQSTVHSNFQHFIC